VAKINALDDAAASPILEAKLDNSGQLEIKALNGARVSVSFVSDSTAANVYDATNTTANLQLAASLGFGDVAEAVLNGATAATDKDTRMTLTSSASLTSTALYKSGAVAKASDLLQDLFTDTASTNALVSAHAASDKIYVGVNNATSKSYAIDNLSVEGLISKINGDFKGELEASFDESTGKLNIRATAASVSTVEFGVDGATAALTERFGFGVQASVEATAAATKSIESIRLGSAAADLAAFESEYNKIRSQIDQLVKDSNYRGTNLLNGDTLLTVFNEDRSTSISTKGEVLTSAGLGIEAANFGNAATVDSALTQVFGATNNLRTFASSLANDLSVIQTRQEFTKQTVNTLQDGSDKLTVADPNEEGAKMLALQTRQQLAVSALSLASQAQQSVLSLLR
jgi:hypothetical protein